ncbi:3-hydroxyacyl-CoA dehydrogenase NAD-binding domain-containing protein [Novosphingobium sp. 9U]|uniref:3-hydroxyacyl-CoA dehydrogenase NAD-binding domain-containing protein n=1 Tax=Novosphingobium sp. 9U TaxID=2653158 RepID=UPI0012F26014|nr:3-hydroxyacyl-CoA dehydrogenase NAD-binding domain-containing protein [Novosphingobium sp. 9U]VWX50587.1 Enoyl-CoA hydratase (isoleucine degradation) [Novosphingobium sp. 9U]
MSGFTYDKDADGIVTITMDMVGQSANTMNVHFCTMMREVFEAIEQDSDVTGVILASAKKTFFAGGDLKEMLESERTAQQLFDYLTETKGYLTRFERLSVPVVAAINGAALGGGYEICLACNYRVAVDAPGVVVGLPEVTLGLLPAGGGVVRSVALLGLEKALPLLLEGKSVPVAKALGMGLVDKLVSDAAQLLPAAKEWIKANPQAAVQPWHSKTFKYPGGDATSQGVRTTVAMATPSLLAKTRGLMPAPEKILDVAVNSMRMGFDSALRQESRAFVSLLRSPEARAQITTFFLQMNGLSKGANRPSSEGRKIRSSAVLGAGMMGQGIAWSHALRGLPVKLKDITTEAAEKGKAYSATVADKQIKQKRLTPEKKQEILDRITPTADYADLQGVDLIVEAVFEEIGLKEKVLKESFACLSSDGVYGTNTSTIPVTLLAQYVPDPSRFIGIHFFSPVDKMQLVEIIRGEETSDETTAIAYDYCKQIGKIPIVVKDGRGFFTSRVFGTYIDEGAALVRDGVAPVTIEREAMRAGMPVGPLAVADETSLSLPKKILDTHEAIDEMLQVKNGYPADMTATREVTFKLVEQGRGGRQYGGGFYRYNADGTKNLWEGLADFATGNLEVSPQDVRDRLLFRQVIETLRCYREGVLRSEAEANIGSIFGFGFPAHTGGSIQFVDWYGTEKFAARAAELADKFGNRFALEDGLLDGLAKHTKVEA